jgi:[ribosomal protein S18]-alanine N-acetyltransferase
MIDVVIGSGIDIPAIMPVMSQAFDPVYGEAWTASQCLSTLSMPGSQLLIATYENQVAGFTLSRAVTDEVELLLIGVAPFAQRTGIGHRLIEILSNISEELGHKTIFLEVRESNSAYNFYYKLGFLPIGRRPAYYKGLDGSRHDSITMAMKF